jgi:hypothetical protein
VLALCYLLIHRLLVALLHAVCSPCILASHQEVALTGIENLQKWYHKVEGILSAYFICLCENFVYDIRLITDWRLECLTQM